MSTSRPFAYNPGSLISGTDQYGNLAVGVQNEPYANNYGGVVWWEGPDEDLGYVIAETVPDNTQPTTNPSVFASVGFYRSELLNESTFINVANSVSGQIFTTGDQAAAWLVNNGYWTSWPVVTNNILLEGFYFPGSVGAGYLATAEYAVDTDVSINFINILNTTGTPLTISGSVQIPSGLTTGYTQVFVDYNYSALTGGSIFTGLTVSVSGTTNYGFSGQASGSTFNVTPTPTSTSPTPTPTVTPSVTGTQIGNTPTPTGTPAAATPTPTRTPPIPSGSALFNKNNFLTVNGNVGTSMGTGDFTWELWVYPTTINGNQVFIDSRTNPLSYGDTTGYYLGTEYDKLTVMLYTDTKLLETTNTLTLNAWNHIALTRQSNTCIIWINGVNGGSVSNSSDLTQQRVNIGGDGTGGNNVLNFAGNLSNVRIVKGVTVYTGPFTPPTNPLATTQSAGVNISEISTGQTQLLLNTVNGVNFLADSSINNFTVTNTGSVVSSVSQPF